MIACQLGYELSDNTPLLRCTKTCTPATLLIVLFPFRRAMLASLLAIVSTLGARTHQCKRAACGIIIIRLAGEHDLEHITLVKNAIHRPDEPRHFMQWKFPDKHMIATINGISIADTKQPLVLSEVGYGIYDPVIYFPIKDVMFECLQIIEKSTFCPLKGDTEYFDLKNAGNEGEKEIAWRYSRPLDFAQKLQDYVAFDPLKVLISIASSP